MKEEVLCVCFGLDAEQGQYPKGTFGEKSQRQVPVVGCNASKQAGAAAARRTSGCVM